MPLHAVRTPRSADIMRPQKTVTSKNSDAVRTVSDARWGRGLHQALHTRPRHRRLRGLSLRSQGPQMLSS